MMRPFYYSGQRRMKRHFSRRGRGVYIGERRVAGGHADGERIVRETARPAAASIYGRDATM